MTTAAPDSAHPQDHGHDAPHDHPKHLAHHFETPQQQFDSGKLGIWLFLTTEILLFSGLFCAYAVYRANHPDIFAYAHLYLNKWLGALNTIVLIFSSFTMAWGVRASQLGQRKLCSILLLITIGCGAIFMCVKAVEYKNKWEEKLLPGPMFNPHLLPGETEKQEEAEKASEQAATASAPATKPMTVLTATAPAIRRSADGYIVEQSLTPRAQVGPAGINPEWETSDSSRFVERFAVASEKGSRTRALQHPHFLRRLLPDDRPARHSRAGRDGGSSVGCSFAISGATSDPNTSPPSISSASIGILSI